MKKSIGKLFLVFAVILFFTFASSRAEAGSYAFAKSKINVRDRYDTSTIIGTAEKGQYFEGTVDDSFLYVRFNGKEGKIYKSVLLFEAPKYMYVTGDLNIRDQQDKVVGIKHRGDQVKVVKIGNYYRYYDKGVKFLYSAYLTDQVIDSSVYAATNINIRDAVNSSNIVGIMNKGTFVRGVERDNYLYFTYNSKEVKIYKPLTLYSVSKTRYVTAAANIRDHNNNIIGLKKAGEQLNYSVLIDNYYRFYEKGVKFIHKSLVRDSKEDNGGNNGNSTVENEIISIPKPLGLMASSASGRIVLSWEPVKGAAGYEVYEAVEQSSRFKKIATVKEDILHIDERIKGQAYKYYVLAYNYYNGKLVKSLPSITVATRPVEESISTIRNYLTNALAPVGSTLYIYGGGRDEYYPVWVNNSTRIGLHEEWREFYLSQDSSYVPENYSYQRSLGLDCSGYLGFVNYNTFNTLDDQEPIISDSGSTGEYLKYMGFGDYEDALTYDNYQAGDIMFKDGHVYIVIGQFDDGSLVVVHSSVKGVKLGATRDRDGNSRNKANALVKRYMSRYFPDYYKRDSRVNTANDYLTNYKKFTWGQNILSDPDGYRDMTAEKILEDLFKYR